MPIAADRTLKYLLRCVLFFCAVGDFTLRVKCISGRSNTFLATICRSTSRRFPGHTHIPCQSLVLWDLLMSQRPQWISSRGKRPHLKLPGPELLSDLPVHSIRVPTILRVTSHTLAASRRASANPLCGSLVFTPDSQLSEVRHMHVIYGFDPPLGTPRLQLALKGLKRSKP